MILIVLCFCALFAYFFLESPKQKYTARLSDNGGLLTGVQNLSAATQLCQSQTSLNYGSQLRSSYVDFHSTRFDEIQDMFLVFLEIQIGHKAKKLEFGIHCRVIPREDTVHYYKAIEKTQQS